MNKYALCSINAITTAVKESNPHDEVQHSRTCACFQQVSATINAIFFPKRSEEPSQEFLSSSTNPSPSCKLLNTKQIWAMILSAHSLFCMQRWQTRNLHWSHTMVNKSASHAHSSQAPPPSVRIHSSWLQLWRSRKLSASRATWAAC
jgi:hypothetical protein